MKKIALFLLVILTVLVLVVGCKSKGSLGDSSSQPHTIDERNVTNPASANPYIKGLQDASIKYNFSKGAKLFLESYPDTQFTSAALTTRNNQHIWDFSATDGTMIYRQELDANSGEVLWDGQIAPPEHLADRLMDTTFDFNIVEDFKSIAKEAIKENGGSVNQIDLVLEGDSLMYYVSIETEEGNLTVPIKRAL